MTGKASGELNGNTPVAGHATGVSATAPDAKPSDMAVLCVDDRPENLLAIEAILDPLNITCVRAASGEEALKCLLERDFAVILMDVQMPGMSGFETAELVKVRERSRYTPIIFLTAISTEPQYVFQGYSAGAVDYLTKPFHPDILRAKVSVFADLYRMQERLRDSERRALELEHRTELLEREAQSREQMTTLNTALRRRTEELETALTARNRFYASMSHELRTPINAIIGYNTLLLDEIYGPLSEKQTHGLKRVQRAAKHLLELVNDVLDLSKIEAGKIELSLQPVGFPALLEDLFVTLRPLAAERGTHIDLISVDEARTVVTDPRRVRQILLNLVSNAIKFGAGKPVRVEYRHAGDNGVEIGVCDEGLGISHTDQHRIFDEFVQLEQPQPDQQGTGLGLPISRRLAVLLGGSLDVESAVGSGSVFRLTLPPTVEEPPPPEALRADHVSDILPLMREPELAPLPSVNRNPAAATRKGPEARKRVPDTSRG